MSGHLLLVLQFVLGDMSIMHWVETHDEKLTNALIQHTTRLCKLACVLGGHYTWEWPERCELWQDRRVRSLLAVAGHFALISASTVDWFSNVKNNEVTIGKRLKIWTTDDRVAEAFHPYYFDPHNDRKTFVDCSGNVAK